MKQPIPNSLYGLNSFGEMDLSIENDDAYAGMTNSFSFDREYAKTSSMSADKVEISTGAKTQVLASDGGGDLHNLTEFMKSSKSEIIQKIVNNLNLNGLSDTEKTQKIVDYVRLDYSYKQDDAIKGEAYKFADKTIADGGGDCEDLVFLAANLLQASGIKSENIKAYVKLGSASDQGHVDLSVNLNGSETKFDMAALTAAPKSAATTRFSLNDQYIQTNILDRSKYDLSVNSSLVERISPSAIGTESITLEDASNMNSKYTSSTIVAFYKKMTGVVGSLIGSLASAPFSAVGSLASLIGGRNNGVSSFFNGVGSAVGTVVRNVAQNPVSTLISGGMIATGVLAPVGIANVATMAVTGKNLLSAGRTFFNGVFSGNNVLQTGSDLVTRGMSSGSSSSRNNISRRGSNYI